MSHKQPTNNKQLTQARAANDVECLSEERCLTTCVPANMPVDGGGQFTKCISCGGRAVLKNYDGEYCKDCMQLHILEKMFVNLTAMQKPK